jgi:hypothetical protein
MRQVGRTIVNQRTTAQAKRYVLRRIAQRIP